MSDEHRCDGPIVSITQDKEYVHLFRHTEAVDYCGIPCVKGVLLATGKGDWRGGLICYLPISSINRILEYESMDHYQQVMKDHYMMKAEE